MRLHAHEWGDASAPPIVCLHGVTAHGGRFGRLAKRLSKRFRIVALDLRGHGHSGWEPPWRIETHLDDVLETVDAAGVDSAIWIGHSFGGRLVIELAAREPARLERAILLDPAIRIRPDNALALADTERPEQRYASLEAVEQPRVVGPLFHTPPEIAAEDRAQHIEPLPDGTFRWRYSQSAVVAIFGELAAWGPPPDTLRVPTLLVLGADDTVVGPRQLDRYRRDLGSRLRVVTVPGGHTVLWDALEETADAVAAFLDAS